jgi:hypothetical protein
VLFVPGFAEQRPGSAIGGFAGAVFRWLFWWNSGSQEKLASPPVLSDTVLSGWSGGDGEPAHLTLAVPLLLSCGERDARWLLAESSWASLFTPPRFLGVARWIWKVSTCLLVLQFVIPMRRHWRRARRPAKSWHRRLADGGMTVFYLLPMAVAAMASVLLSLALLALAVAEKLPIPRIDQAVRWVAVKVSSVLGDSYMLAHCPVQFAAMRAQVAHDLQWMQDRCEKVVVVAHSQGAAIAHQVLKDDRHGPGKVRAFVTIGQGISKFHLLWRMDWDPEVRRAAWWSRTLVTTGLVLTGLPALGLLARHWSSTTVITRLAGLPVIVPVLAAGFVFVGIGVIAAMRAICGDLEQSMALPDAGFWWRDYYASADPVSNGPLLTGERHTPGPQPDIREEPGVVPEPCNLVYNSASILFDHNRYLRNQDQVLSRVLNDLTAAAYGNSAKIIADGDLIKVGQRRHRLILWLIAGRILTLCAATGLWCSNLGPLFNGPMNRVADLLHPHTQMNNSAARAAAALLMAAALYIGVIIAWRIGEKCVIRRFFRTAQRLGSTAEQDHPKTLSHAVAAEASASVG